MKQKKKIKRKKWRVRKDSPLALKTKEALKEIGIKLHTYRIELPDDWKWAVYNLYLLGYTDYQIAIFISKRLRAELNKRGIKKTFGACKRINKRKDVVAYNIRKITGKEHFKQVLERDIRVLRSLRRKIGSSSNNKAS